MNTTSVAQHPTGATVLPFRAADVDPEWLTAERLTAYCVALSVNPEIAHASPIVRAGMVQQVIAGLRAASACTDALDTRGRLQCLGLMQHDAEAATREGWRW